MNVRTKKKKKSLLLHAFLCPPFFTATLSEPHDGSQTPLICRKNKEKERKERRKNFSLSSLPFSFYSLSL